MAHPACCLPFAVAVWSQSQPKGRLLFSADWNKPATGTVELGVQLSGIMLFEQMAKLTRSTTRGNRPSP